MDSKNIIISQIKNKKNDKILNWNFYKEHKAADALGFPLIINLDKEEFEFNEEIILRIDYSTTKDSEVNQWFYKEQTYLKEYPFMYTQCQAILARSLLPCQVKYFLKNYLRIHLPQKLQLVQN